MNAERFHGLYASIILPMRADGAIDEAGLTAHVRTVLACPGMHGLLINGHAGENAFLTREEMRRVIRLCREAAGKAPIVAGVIAEASAAAAIQAQDAAAEGADAIMVFAPFSWGLGVDPRVVLRHHQAIHDATDLPLFLFQGHVRSGGLHFPPDLLKDLLRLPKLVGIKEGSWDSAAYDETRRVTAETRPDVAVMASGDEHLFACFLAGSAGSLVSLAAVVPEMVVALDRAVKAEDLPAARALHERLAPLAKAIYGTAPPGLATPRLKACLNMLGRLPVPVCRAPLPMLEAAETDALRAALVHAGAMP
ncbi:dihydrodipicolinate synthase family protein [Pararoseomonas indoligenes]|uniref:Dihydrodipicolinate synthase family protein n=1 Tax=Roseomonas indoligenes TaxID=2820811 RepID=A0A940N148_9PROT|nr:dihydrodipicolinate synthase family protein [Pararoseomonas indoligenes]MBP0495338.1 dihydrodipicolinate synthase family protein [Pararoseomonas indoligenes]